MPAGVLDDFLCDLRNCPVICRHSHDPLGGFPRQPLGHASGARQVSVEVRADLTVGESLDPCGFRGREQYAEKADATECLCHQVRVDDAGGLHMDAPRVTLGREDSSHGAHGVDRHSLTILVVRRSGPSGIEHVPF